MKQYYWTAVSVGAVPDPGSVVLDVALAVRDRNGAAPSVSNFVRSLSTKSILIRFYEMQIRLLGLREPLPATAQSLVQSDQVYRLCSAALREKIFVCIERALRIEHGQEISKACLVKL